LLVGALIPTRYCDESKRAGASVSIPFSSGHLFQLTLAGRRDHGRHLRFNPLLVGALIPTAKEKMTAIKPASAVSIPSSSWHLFRLVIAMKASERQLLFQSPSRRGTYSTSLWLDGETTVAISVSIPFSSGHLFQRPRKK